MEKYKENVYFRVFFLMAVFLGAHLVCAGLGMYAYETSMAKHLDLLCVCVCMCGVCGVWVGLPLPKGHAWTRWRNQVAKLCEEGLVNHSSLSTYVTKGYMCHSLTIWLRFRIYNIILRIMHGSSPILVCVIHMRMRCDRTKNIRRLFKFIHTSTEMHISSEYYSCSWRFLWYKLWANLLCCLCGMNAIDERGIV